MEEELELYLREIVELDPVDVKDTMRVFNDNYARSGVG